MIEFRDGDIFMQDDLHVIVQQCNCFNKMRSGFAKEIATRYPEAVDADNRTKPGDKSKLGSYTCGVGKDDMHIINMYGQYNYGREKKCYTDYDAVRKALNEIKDDYATPFPPMIIGMPYKIGCSLGGGNWDIVLQIIKDVFENENDCKIVICRKE